MVQKSSSAVYQENSILLTARGLPICTASHACIESIDAYFVEVILRQSPGISQSRKGFLRLLYFHSLTIIFPDFVVQF